MEAHNSPGRVYSRMRKLLLAGVIILLIVLSDFDVEFISGTVSTLQSKSRTGSTDLSVNACPNHVVVLKENPGMFGEVQEFLVAGFKELGFNTSYLTPNECNGEGSSAGLVTPLCQSKGVLGVSTTLCTSNTIKSFPMQPLWVNLEVLQPELKAWSRKCLEPLYAEVLWSSGPVWDYLHDNIQFIKGQGWTIQDPLYLPLRYYKGIVYTDLHYGDWDTPTADVAFVGTTFNSPRRKDIINELRRRGAKVDVIEGVFGLARERRVRAAKVSINIHFYPRNFETVRLFWLLSLGAFVVAEGDPAMHETVMKEYEGGLVLASYKNLVDTVMAYLDKPHERRKVAEAGYNFIRATSPGEVLRPLLKESLPSMCMSGDAAHA